MRASRLIIITKSRNHDRFKGTCYIGGNNVVELLLSKLIASQTLVGEESEIEEGRLSQDFRDSHKLFQNKDDEHDKGHI